MSEIERTVYSERPSYGEPWPVAPGTWVNPPTSNYGFTEKPWWWDAQLPAFGGKEGAGAAARAAIAASEQKRGR